MLKENEHFLSYMGITYTVMKCLGSGGQGEVYEVAAGHDHYALKWYHPHMATPIQKKRIQYLIENGMPDKRFLWPIDFIEKDGRFGYVMPLRPNHYKSIVDLMKRKAEPSFEALCHAGYELADCFQTLHSMGYCYGDLSFGNAFLDPETGNILICDNDNVVVNGKKDQNVEGTLGFMAPEIVRGEAGPSNLTDLFSLAVLLFYMFMLHHPLEGAREASIKCLDLVARQKLYGKEPIFIWDPENIENRPIAGYQDNAIIYWRLYPDFMRELFIKSFTTGLNEPKERIVENQWKKAFMTLKDSIMFCPDCQVELFYNGEAKVNSQPICWCCHHGAPLPLVLEIGEKRIVLGGSSVIYQHHLDNDLNTSEVVARVSRHPKDPQKWGLTNKTKEIWLITKPNGEMISVPPEKSFLLMPGITIVFNEKKSGQLTRG